MPKPDTPETETLPTSTDSPDVTKTASTSAAPTTPERRALSPAKHTPPHPRAPARPPVLRSVGVGATSASTHPRRTTQHKDRSSMATTSPKSVPECAYVCLARSRVSDGHFRWPIDGRECGVVIGEMQPRAGAVDTRLYAFADAPTNTLRQKWLDAEELYRECVPFGSLVRAHYTPHDDAHKPSPPPTDNTDVLETVAALVRSISEHHASAKRLEAKKRRLETLADLIGTGKRLRRSATHFVDVVASTGLAVPSTPDYWRITQPLLPTEDVRALCKHIDGTRCDPERTTRGAHNASTFLRLEDLAAEIDLTHTAQTCLRAVLAEVVQQCGAPEKGVRAACPPTTPPTFTVRLHRFPAQTEPQWTSLDDQHVRASAMVVLHVGENGNRDAEGTRSGHAFANCESRGVPPYRHHVDGLVVEMYSDVHGRMRVAMEPGGVYVFTPRVWTNMTSDAVWYALELEVDAV